MTILSNNASPDPGTAEATSTTRGNPALGLNWSEINSFEHFVQFYGTDAFLLDSLSGFISAGLLAGDACIVIATPMHCADLEKRLQAHGLDLLDACRRDAYIVLDAAEVLTTFMVDGSPVPERFTEVVEGLIARAAQSGRHVRIFGEMVALLWAEGNQAAAVNLEELWNHLHQKTSPFALFCAYPMHDFAGEIHRTGFIEILQQHARVLPTESYSVLASSEERLRTIALLQQQASSLQAEVAERQKTEETLLYLAAIVESSQDAILSKDLDGIITSWNAAAERIYGYSAQEIVGQPVSLLFAPDQQDEFIQIMERIRRGERVDHYEARRVRKDGTFLTVSVAISPIKDRTGTIIGASAIAHDITEHKQLEAKFQQLFHSSLIGVFISDFAGTFLDANDALLDLLGYTRSELQAGAMQRDSLTPPQFHSLGQKAVQALQASGLSEPYETEYLHKDGKPIPVLVAVTRIEQTDTCIGFVLDIRVRKELDKRKDTFISMASHELKTPVTSLKGFLHLLRRSATARKNAEELHYLDRMDAQIDRLTKLINDLLNLSQMQTGQLVYRDEYFALDALIQESLENTQKATQTHRLRLDGQTQAVVFGDRDRIGQVLLNLLNNAMKYSPQANTVLVHVAKKRDEVIVSVQDFGVGIAKEHQRKVFERFYHINDPKGKTSPGLGIGLSISHEIVKRHGGRLWLESEKGKGATFHFTLPLSRENESPDTMTSKGQEG
jgi:PAS domain S-box-containing protein